MSKNDPEAWMLMPVFRARIERFDREYSLDGNATNLAAAFEECFASGDRRMFGVLLYDNDIVRGHVVAGIDTYHGTPQAVVYQFEKDVVDDDATNDWIQTMIDAWVLSLGLTEVTALATSPGRARHFGKWDYEYTATLVTRRIGKHGGKEFRRDVVNIGRDPGVDPGSDSAASDVVS